MKEVAIDPMNKSRKRILFVSFLAVLSSCAARSTSGQLEPLDWLLGDWSVRKGENVITESWRPVSSNTYEGAGDVVAGNTGEVVSAESLRLVEMSGEIFYLAKVDQNELPVAFKLVECSPHHAVFENAGHDFPRRIEYQLVDAHNLTVTVGDGKGRGFSIEFTRRGGAR